MYGSHSGVVRLNRECQKSENGWHISIGESQARHCLYSDDTLDIMDDVTVGLGVQFHEFHDKTCPIFQTWELPCEAAACQRHTQKNHQSGANTETNNKEPYLKNFNLETYKYHSLGKYVATIHRFGTTDSYSTTTVFMPSTATTLFL